MSLLDRAGLGERRGGAYLWRALGTTFAAWLLHALLRTAQLARPTPFGHPFVEKFEWYFFHGAGYDILWSLPIFLPLVLFYLFVPEPEAPTWKFKTPLWIAVLLYSPFFFLTVGDHELMRFMAVHGNISRMKTYLGVESIREMPSLLATDRGGPYFSLLLAFGTPLVFPFLGWAWGRWMGRRARRPLVSLLVVLLLPLVSYLLLFHLWKGSFRLKKMQPWPVSVLQEFGSAPEAQLDPQTVSRMKKSYRDLWSSTSARPWVFPRGKYPFYRMTLEEACKRGEEQGERCDQDQDGDGFSARKDCHDGNASIFPGAHDVPGNGVDEDCSGLDERPWNVVMILLESHRGLNTGHLKPHGSKDDATPFLDELAQDGAVWTRHSVNGLPTIEGFFASHCSLFSQGNRHTATSDTHVTFRCLPSLLSEAGYATRFFTAAAPDWDGQTHWLGQWYDTYDFSRDRQTDLKMFSHMGQWMKDNLSEEKPFFIGAITKTNHFPFNPVDDMTDAEKAATPDNVSTTMRYTDRALRGFFDSVRDEPWFDRTVFIMTADHGVNLGEHGSWRMGDPLHRATTWLPMVMVGAHPELPGKGQWRKNPTSHVDLLPTVLDLVGMTPPTASVGHSMLPESPNSYVFSNYNRDLVWEQGQRRSLVSRPGYTRKDGDQIFDNQSDFHEMHDLSGDEAEESALQRAGSLSRDLYLLTLHTIRNNRVWPSSGEACEGDCDENDDWF